MPSGIGNPTPNIDTYYKEVRIGAVSGAHVSEVLAGKVGSLVR
jgi:hypothetical protein